MFRWNEIFHDLVLQFHCIHGYDWVKMYGLSFSARIGCLLVSVTNDMIRRGLAFCLEYYLEVMCFYNASFERKQRPLISDMQCSNELLTSTAEAARSKAQEQQLKQQQLTSITEAKTSTRCAANSNELLNLQLAKSPESCSDNRSRQAMHSS
ncbi:Uncharacterized protein TCM_034408 [Theobroma cacao]|uniref:Uncharacterized protein n=1 Tax=Theobroma cacao TaxID=3641 RepID=A0A061FE19_THECC|nr:Uncharacterized protein TCM_034408 [Theobroma cacao]